MFKETLSDLLLDSFSDLSANKTFTFGVNPVEDDCYSYPTLALTWPILQNMSSNLVW